MNHYRSLSEWQNRSRFDQAIEQIQKTAGLVPDSLASIEAIGFHLYSKLDLAVEYTDSAIKEDRSKNLKLLGDFTNVFREIVVASGGELLEAQGSVVHGFIPDGNQDSEVAQEALETLMEYVRRKIQSRAGDAYRKCTAAFDHGPTIFVEALDAQKDSSLVSLSRAANRPAKLLWGNDELEDKGVYSCVVPIPVLLKESVVDSTMRANIETRALEIEKTVAEVVCRAPQTVPDSGSPMSPTLNEPAEFYGIAIRADIHDFSQGVEQAFLKSEAERAALAQQFRDLMIACSEFAQEHKLNIVQLPWAGDSFNILIECQDRDEYQKLREAGILQIVSEFEDYLTEEFPQVEWSFSVAAGDLENAQVCNTLVARLEFTNQTKLLSAGLPVQRSLIGQVTEDVDPSEGVLWKEDKNALCPRYQRAIKVNPTNSNYHGFEVDKVRQLIQIPEAPHVYTPQKKLAAAGISTPTVRNHAIGS